jgi:outer membrane autotransporter protein
VWARGFYGRRLEKADGPSLANATNFYGGAIGFERQVAPDLKLGALAGGGHISTAIDMNAGSSTSDLGFAGVYGRKDFGSAFVDFNVIAGGSANSSLRGNINNNLVAGGIETATANFGGWFFSPEAVAGNRFQLTPEWMLTPAARLRYLAAGFDGYTESGSTADMTVGSRFTQALEQRGELTLTRTLTSNLGRFQIGSTLGLIGQERVGAGSINAQILGQALSFATPGKASIGGGFVAGQFDWKTRWGATLFASAEYTAYSDSSTILTGHAGIRVGF